MTTSKEIAFILAYQKELLIDRIISMLNVSNGNLVVDAKAIYSIEKFIIARRLMYWQVYLHKTVLSAEFSLVEALKRAKTLVKKA